MLPLVVMRKPKRRLLKKKRQLKKVKRKTSMHALAVSSSCAPTRIPQVNIALLWL